MPKLDVHGNRQINRYLAAHFLTVIAEWASLIGLLVYVFDRSGVRAVGLASLASLAPYVLLASTTARIAQRRPAATVRAVSIVTQTLGYGAAGLCALADGPIWIAVAATVVAITAVTAMRPSGAVLLPFMARSSLQLTTANVRAGYTESASVLLGPLAATALLALGGGAAVLIGAAAFTLAAVALAVADVRGGPPPSRSDPIRPSGPRTVRHRLVSLCRAPFDDLTSIARRPGTRGVLAASTGQYVLVGAFDVLLVVIAGDYVDLGESGAGILSACFGAGALASIAWSGRLARRSRVGPAIVVCLAIIAAACLVFGWSVTIVMACVALPILGAGRSTIDLLSRVLLQRSAPPSELAMVFGALETSAGIGLLLGSLIAQLLLAASGATAALVGLGVLYLLLTLTTYGPLRAADESADVPVVAMSLLRQLPIFEPLPPVALEAVARNAIELPVHPGQTIITEGEAGDRYYAVADGEFRVSVAGDAVRTIGRGGGFGDVALLADIPRTATVIASSNGQLLAIDRTPFLTAVTGLDQSHRTAWSHLLTLQYADDVALPDLPVDEPR